MTKKINEGIQFKQFCDKLDQFINTGRTDCEKDFCPSGLIVDPVGIPSRKIYRVVTGVSLRLDLIKKAAKMKADAIIVHHPNGWWFGDKNKCIAGNGQFAQYTRMLFNHNIALFGYHLPLDSHVRVGNNPTLFSMLDLNEDITDRMAIGNVRANGNEVNVTNVDKIRAAEKFLNNVGIIGRGKITADLLMKVFPKGYWSRNFTSGKEYKVAICTGSGTSGLDEALEKGCNMFITGEIRESTPIFSDETGMAIIAAGHHRSEVFCVRNLANYINKSGEFGVKATFVDIDNPL